MTIASSQHLILILGVVIAFSASVAADDQQCKNVGYIGTYEGTAYFLTGSEYYALKMCAEQKDMSTCSYNGMTWKSTDKEFKAVKDGTWEKSMMPGQGQCPAGYEPKQACQCQTMCIPQNQAPPTQSTSKEPSSPSTPPPPPSSPSTPPPPPPPSSPSTPPSTPPPPPPPPPSIIYQPASSGVPIYTASPQSSEVSTLSPSTSSIPIEAIPSPFSVSPVPIYTSSPVQEISISPPTYQTTIPTSISASAPAPAIEKQTPVYVMTPAFSAPSPLFPTVQEISALSPTSVPIYTMTPISYPAPEAIPTYSPTVEAPVPSISTEQIPVVSAVSVPSYAPVPGYSGAPSGSLPCNVGKDPDCEICHTNGCDKCKDGYFKLNYSTPCKACKEIKGCTQCTDFFGCQLCEGGKNSVKQGSEQVCP